MLKKLKPEEIGGLLFITFVIVPFIAFILFLIGLGLYSFINIIF